MNKTTQIRLATPADIIGILALQAANQPAQGCMISANFSREQILQRMTDLPMIIAERDGQITGYLMNSTRAASHHSPILTAMLTAYSGSDNAYIFGPICVSAEERGKGIAQQMFAKIRKLLPQREGILFIRRDNLPSLRAHEKMGMQDVASFIFNGQAHAVFAYIG